MPAPVGIGVDRETYLKHLHEKKLRLDALCEAAKAYLSCELDSEIEELSKPQPTPAEFPSPGEFMYGPCPTTEELMRAGDSVQKLEEQIEKLGVMTTQGPAAEFLGPLVEGMYLPMIQQQLDQAIRYRDGLQKRMEAGAKEKESV